MQILPARYKDATSAEMASLETELGLEHAGQPYRNTDTGIIYVWDGSSFEPYQRVEGGAAFVAEVGITNQRHNRYLADITNTWPGDDTFSVAFTQTENVRRYRVFASRTSYDLWTAATAYAVGAIVHPTAAVDNAGSPDLVFIVDSIAGTGTSAGAEPTWPTVVGDTVIDNSGANQITWKALPAKAVYMKVAEDAANEAQEEAWLADPSSNRTTNVAHYRVFDGVWSEWQELSKYPDDDSLSRLGFLANADTWDIFVEAE